MGVFFNEMKFSRVLIDGGGGNTSADSRKFVNVDFEIDVNLWSVKKLLEKLFSVNDLPISNCGNAALKSANHRERNNYLMNH